MFSHELPELTGNEEIPANATVLFIRGQYPSHRGGDAPVTMGLWGRLSVKASLEVAARVDRIVIVTGTPWEDYPTIANLMKKNLRDHGVPEEKIIAVHDSHNPVTTIAETEAFQKIIKNRPDINYLELATDQHRQTIERQYHRHPEWRQPKGFLTVENLIGGKSQAGEKFIRKLRHTWYGKRYPMYEGLKRILESIGLERFLARYGQATRKKAGYQIPGGEWTQVDHVRIPKL